MLHLSQNLMNVAILSLRVGAPVATAQQPIINPNNLKIEGFLCSDGLVLLVDDIREVVDDGFIVDDHEVLTGADDLVRLRDIVDLEFDLIGKNVRTTNKEKIGKVTDFATDFSSFYIQKLYVGRSLLKHLTSGSLVVERTNIVEITKHDIVIAELLRGTLATAQAA